MAGFAALLVLAGCSEPSPANDTLPTAGSTLASPTLEPLGPVDFPVPDEAREQTEAAAVVMAKYYVDLSFYTAESLDPSWMEQLSQACENCQADIESYSADRAAGNQFNGGDAVVQAFFDRAISDSEMSVGVAVDRAAFQVVGPAGEPLDGREVPAQRLSGGLTLSWDTSRSVWLTTSLYLEQAS
ncbi:hypothetical protein [Klenkia taihuensis]|uniref:hypothetical protein n=1 Tax=Klenkia taihuensis TaxID=1225127 RepID=UPI000B89FAC2|nr:hypothetical protein [Klenkia taihuensis]